MAKFMIFPIFKTIYMILGYEPLHDSIRCKQVYPTLKAKQVRIESFGNLYKTTSILIEADNYEDLDLGSIKALYF